MPSLATMTTRSSPRSCDGGCDNWFHFECVGLAQAPRGEYICDACGAGFGFRRAYDDDEDNRAIACLQANPKKPGTACNLRYEAYKSATTVAEFLEKGGTPADLTHDVGKGFVWYVDDGRLPRGNQLTRMNAAERSRRRRGVGPSTLILDGRPRRPKNRPENE